MRCWRDPRHPEAEAFGGPIRARFEGPAPRGCGREDPPITTLDLGPHDREAEMVWGANSPSAARRSSESGRSTSRSCGRTATRRRARAAAGRRGADPILAAAGLDHRRTADDARLGALARAAYVRGRAARADDRRVARRDSRASCGYSPAVAGTPCAEPAPQGVVMGAHSAGRVVETMRSR